MREIYDVNSKSHWLQFVQFLKISNVYYSQNFTNASSERLRSSFPLATETSIVRYDL